MPTGNRQQQERFAAHQELRRFEDRLPELLKTITPQAAVLAWLMMGDKMWNTTGEREE